MIKKLLILFFLFLFPLCTLAEELRIHQDSGEHDRVKLRESPGGRVIGQYYNDVLVTPLETKGDWTHISIGGREGWMMSEFLLPADEEWLASEGWAGQGESGMPYFEEEGLPLFSAPDADSAVQAWLDAALIEVLGTVDDDWLHLRVQKDEQVYYGYASAWAVTWTENLAHADVDTGDAAQRLNLREAPSTSAKIIAELYSGTRVHFLFDDHTNGDGWAKVRVGDLMGYVSTEYLNYSSAGVLPFEPPMCLLEDGRTAQVLAVREAEVYVKPMVQRGVLAHFWISRNSASCYTPRSASTHAVTNREVAVIGCDIVLPAGHPVAIYGSFDPEASTHAWGYVHPDHPLLNVDFFVPDKNSMYGGYLPVDCVDFDPLLLAPSAK